jgi:tetratricopeptide (TPR) repeat protein
MSQRSQELFEVNLTLTGDQDEQLQTLTHHMGKEVSGSTGWGKLARVLFMAAAYEKALEIYTKLLKHATDQQDTSLYCHQLGTTRDVLEGHTDALEYTDKSLQINKKSLPPDHPDTVELRENIDFVHKKLQG